MGITGRTRCFVTMEYTTNESKMHSQSDCPVKLASAYVLQALSLVVTACGEGIHIRMFEQPLDILSR
jgi:hypothetical protein